MFPVLVQAQEAYQLSLPGITETIRLVPLESGEFTRGSPVGEDDEKPTKKVIVNGFWMASMEITWPQYEAYLYRDSLNEEFQSAEKLEQLGVDGISGATQPYVDMSFGMGKEGYPVVNITQHAALMFCKWLTAITGDFYRLPTEAEWEYACLAGEASGLSAETDKRGWYAGNSGEAYHEVGTKEGNPWGLYDMLGNVSEWTMDQYQKDYYSSSEVDNPWNVPSTLYPRVVKGGSWKDEVVELRCANRQYSSPKWKRRDPQLPKSAWWHTNAPFVGFRIVRPFQTPSASEIEAYWLPLKEDF